jgi:hypothetical protein
MSVCVDYRDSLLPTQLDLLTAVSSLVALGMQALNLSPVSSLKTFYP